MLARAVEAQAPAFLVKDVNAHPHQTIVSSDPASFVTIGTTTFFSAFEPAGGRELWKTDGTSAGTVLVKDINPSGDCNGDGTVTVDELLTAVSAALGDTDCARCTLADANDDGLSPSTRS